jgi:ribosome-associated translation inhibitor RaiA
MGSTIQEATTVTFPIQITFKGFPSSPAVDHPVRDRARRLEHHHGRITDCRVVLEAPHRHHRKGKLYDVRIDLVVPGGELFVHPGGQANHAHEDIAVAIRDAFNAMERKLIQFVRKRGDHAA